MHPESLPPFPPDSYEPECVGSCDNCGRDMYDDEPDYMAGVCDQCAWWIEEARP